MKVSSSEQTKCKTIINVILVVLVFATVITCCSLTGKLISDFNQEKVNHEEALNNVKSAMTDNINHLNQSIKQQYEILGNQNILLQNHTQTIKNYTEIVDNQNKAINDFTNVIQNLQNQQNEVDDNLLALNERTNITSENLIKGYVILDDDWIAPLNGYQYKLVRSSRSWASARSYCQSNYGADLASLGVQSMKIRRILRREINYTSYVWIGLNDLITSGKWQWISSGGNWNGDYATNDISLWYRDPPGSYSSSYDCAVLYSSSAYAYPRSCSSTYYFLCEKQNDLKK